MKFKTVKNLNTLKAMQKRGLIKFCDQTGEKITGLYTNKLFTCYYIDEATNPYFTYKDKEYKEQYFDGCFMPFVVEIIKN